MKPGSRIQKTMVGINFRGGNARAARDTINTSKCAEGVGEASMTPGPPGLQVEVCVAVWFLRCRRTSGRNLFVRLPFLERPKSSGTNLDGHLLSRTLLKE
jgi:hypothetical protein